jgi:hypothetical protein
MFSNLMLLHPIQQTACGKVLPLLVGAYVQPITIISPICGCNASFCRLLVEYRSGIVTVNRLDDAVSFFIFVLKKLPYRNVPSYYIILFYIMIEIKEVK